MPKMKFAQDHFVDGGDKIRYAKGSTHNVPKESVERWLKRGAIIVGDADGSDEEIRASLDAGLAAELEKDGKGTHDETLAALDKVDSVDSEEEEFEDEEDDSSTSKKSQSSKKTSSKSRR